MGFRLRLGASYHNGHVMAISLSVLSCLYDKTARIYVQSLLN